MPKRKREEDSPEESMSSHDEKFVGDDEDDAVVAKPKKAKKSSKKSSNKSKKSSKSSNAEPSSSKKKAKKSSLKKKSNDGKINLHAKVHKSPKQEEGEDMGEDGDVDEDGDEVAEGKKPGQEKSVEYEADIRDATFTPKAFKRTPLAISGIAADMTVSAADARAILDQQKEIKSMMDRTGSVPVSVYILSTLTSGLPLFQRLPKVNQEIITCLNYIFASIKKQKEPSVRRRWTMEVATAYQSCQTIQQQAITSLYASMNGIDLSFEAQLMQMLGAYKGRKLDELVIKLNPNANSVGDDDPTCQPPHIKSAYVLALDKAGYEVDGKEAAELDVNKPHLSKEKQQIVVEGYKSLVCAPEFVLEFAAEINHKGGFAQHLDRDKFYKWVMEVKDESLKIDKHDVFYQMEKANEYSDVQKESEQGIVPFLSRPIARALLRSLGLVS